MINDRQKVLLQTINHLIEKNLFGKTYLIKSLFLLKQKFGFEQVPYDFFPYQFGPFSFKVYEDIIALTEKELFNEKNKTLTEKGKNILKKTKLNENIQCELTSISKKFSDKNEIKAFVYEKYPEFAPKKRKSGKGIYSIGYEGKSMDCFLNYLLQNEISLLVDVRKNAFSFKKGFSKAPLQEHLKKVGVEYLHFSELGIDSNKRKHLNTTQDYANLFEDYRKTLPSKQNKIDEVNSLAQNQKLALMCFEANKNYCHRGVLSDFVNDKVTHI